MLECVLNISEGRDRPLVDDLAASAAAVLLDVHSDPWHNRSVLTLAGPDADVLAASRGLARAVVDRLDLAGHQGAHPRLGVLDVVPFIGLQGWPLRDAGLADMRAIRARDEFGAWAASELGLPVFAYGPERSLPAVRRAAFNALSPDWGPPVPDPHTGAVAVGCRPLMVAYNLWLARPDLEEAKVLARSLRSPAVRALAFALGGNVQVSFNLLRPLEVGPARVMAAVAQHLPVDHAELVGLMPLQALEQVPRRDWSYLGLSEEQTIESRLTEAQRTG